MCHTGPGKAIDLVGEAPSTLIGIVRTDGGAAAETAVSPDSQHLAPRLRATAQHNDNAALPRSRDLSFSGLIETLRKSAATLTLLLPNRVRNLP